VKTILETKEIEMGGEILRVELCLIKIKGKYDRIRPFIKYPKYEPRKPFQDLLDKCNKEDDK
jgi:hypothetical protein